MPLESITTDEDGLHIRWSFPFQAQGVWAGITDEALLTRWLGQPLECDVRPGGTLVIDHGEGFVSRSLVMEADQPHRLVMTWEFPDEPESLLRSELRPSDSGTRMDLEHCHLGGLVRSYGPGWITHLTYLEAAVAGTPLPASQFWPLHATLETLYAGRIAGAVRSGT